MAAAPRKRRLPTVSTPGDTGQDGGWGLAGGVQVAIRPGAPLPSAGSLSQHTRGPPTEHPLP